MTELAHVSSFEPLGFPLRPQLIRSLSQGSNVAGLETTGTFDEGSDEFVIHTPSVSATKWWIGGKLPRRRSFDVADFRLAQVLPKPLLTAPSSLS